MKCISCGAEVPSTFKHSIMKNECPCCGKCLLDEESLALIENIENTIKSGAAVREETAHSLAIMLIAEYEINMRKDNVKIIKDDKVVEKPKQAVKSSSISEEDEKNIIKTPEIPEGISEAEREKIMEQALKERYDFVGDDNFDVGELDDPGESGSMFSNEDSILEKERIARLSKQQNILNGGGKGAFRRSG